MSSLILFFLPSTIISVPTRQLLLQVLLWRGQWDRGGGDSQQSVWHMEPQLVTAAERGQAALLDSQLGFSSLASIPVITKIHTGDKDAAGFLPHLAPEMSHSHSRGSWGTASRLLQASTCPGHLQPPGLLVCKVKWHQQDKSSLQPKARSFQPTFARDRIPRKPTKPSSSQPHFQVLTYFVL